MMTKNKAEVIAAVLRATIKLLDGGKRWTRNVNAMDKNECAVYFHRDEAICFCLNGGLKRSIFDLFNPDMKARSEAAMVVREFVYEQLFEMGYGAYTITEWNDAQREYLPVGKLLESAAVRAEEIIESGEIDSGQVKA